MAKRAVIVHGWGGFPGEAWFPWLKGELEKKEFTVQVPSMPHPDEPTIDDWVEALATTVGTPDKNLVLIGHSIGCQTIMRYVMTLKENERVGNLVLVAGFYDLTGIEEDEEKELAKPWLTEPIDDEKIKTSSGIITAIFSTDDPYVEYASQSENFRLRLGATIISEDNKGHLGQSEGFTELPSALKAALA